MHTLLDALQGGRLIELPDNAKDRALQLLGSVIEAVPSVPPGTDMVGAVAARERTSNTGLGEGWACPHARMPFDGDLVCAIGWSPSGIDYGSADGRPVRVVVMYFIPENQKGNYLREISGLAKALRNPAAAQALGSATSLDAVRNGLLDLITASRDAGGPESRARIIRLEARAAQTVAGPAMLSRLDLQTASIIAIPGGRPVVLSQHPDLLLALEAEASLTDLLARQGNAETPAWRILSRSATPYAGDRVLYECLAIRKPGP